MADVVHEEEAYLSCSSSDYDEHADLSTDAEDLADTDFEGSVQHLGIEPYQYEPYLSDAGGKLFSFVCAPGMTITLKIEFDKTSN